MFILADQNIVIKRTIGCSYGMMRSQGKVHRVATPFFYLSRILVTNEVFNSGIRMEGICAEDYSVVTKHRFVKAANDSEPYPSEDEISQFMRASGFKLVRYATTQWFRTADRILVADTRSQNFIKAPPVADDPYGLVPIDVIVSQEPEDVEIETD